jgi:CheY-like chemotaxis protein
LGGEIFVEIIPDSGNTFTVELEKASSQSSLIQELSGLSQSVTNLEVLCGACILLCEGNEVSQETTRLYLKRLGCHPKIAESGKVGFEYWEKNTYDLILMDCQMPVMDGFETTRRIRKLEFNPTSSGRTPIVALTAFAMEGERNRCIAAGMDNYLSKPFTAHQLAKTLIATISKVDEKHDKVLPVGG